MTTDDISSRRTFEEEHFDFPDVVVGHTSTMNTTLDLVKSVALSRPFLLAVIAFLIYRLWKAPSGTAILSVTEVPNKTSERMSVKKSIKSMLPPVTMAGSSSTKRA